MSVVPYLEQSFAELTARMWRTNFQPYWFNIQNAEIGQLFLGCFRKIIRIKKFKLIHWQLLQLGFWKLILYRYYQVFMIPFSDFLQNP